MITYNTYMDNKQGITEMNNLLFSKDLQVEWRGKNNEYGGTIAFGEDLDAKEYIPVGSMIRNEQGETCMQVIKRGTSITLYNSAKDPVAKKKRGRPAKPDAKTNAERQAEFRAKKKAEGICPCCGQHLLI